MSKNKNLNKIILTSFMEKICSSMTASVNYIKSAEQMPFPNQDIDNLISGSKNMTYRTSDELGRYLPGSVYRAVSYDNEDIGVNVYIDSVKKVSISDIPALHASRIKKDDPAARNVERIRFHIDKMASSMTALPHQERLKQKLEKEKGVLAYHGLGSGKTFASIHAAEELGLPLLAVVPASLRGNFKKEIEKSEYKGDAKVISYEQAVKLIKDKDFRRYAKNALVVFDEAHRMGREGTNRSQLAIDMPSKKTLLLTGTPIRNKPDELVPLIRAMGEGDLPKSHKQFRETFIEENVTRPGFFGRLIGRVPKTETKAINIERLKKFMKGRIDYHQSIDPEQYPEVAEKVIETPMTKVQQDTYDFVMGTSPSLAYKIRYGIPPNRTEIGKMQSFMIGPRLIGNNPESFNLSATTEDSSKVQTMANEIESHYKSDPNFKGVTYSAFLDSGINSISRELSKKNIPHIRFTGEMNDKQKAEAVRSYNRGEKPVMLISGAGSEGLDLKGTKLMQIMEPHWNEEQINQVKGRAIRYGSHAHLPPEERKVEVQRFHSTLRDTFVGNLKNKVYQALGMEPTKEYSADQYLNQLSKKKDEVNQLFLEALREVANEED